jgi:hypothetical protein
MIALGEGAQTVRDIALAIYAKGVIHAYLEDEIRTVLHMLMARGLASTVLTGDKVTLWALTLRGAARLLDDRATPGHALTQSGNRREVTIARPDGGPLIRLVAESDDAAELLPCAQALTSALDAGLVAFPPRRGES